MIARRGLDIDFSQKCARSVWQLCGTNPDPSGTILDKCPTMLSKKRLQIIVIPGPYGRCCAWVRGGWGLDALGNSSVVAVVVLASSFSDNLKIVTFSRCHETLTFGRYLFPRMSLLENVMVLKAVLPVV